MSRMSSGEPSGVSPLQEIHGVTTRRRFFKSATRSSLRSVGSTKEPLKNSPIHRLRV